MLHKALETYTYSGTAKANAKNGGMSFMKITQIDLLVFTLNSLILSEAFCEVDEIPNGF